MSIRLPTLTAIGAASLVSVVALAQPLKCTSESPDVVCTEQGAVRGIAEERTLAFKGVPYAQPPVGSLRWKAPLPAANWEGVRDGGRYGAMCPQLIAGEVKGDEDCHYVNVWRPQVRQPQRPPRPQPGSKSWGSVLVLVAMPDPVQRPPVLVAPLGH
jgi:para-nitrobenzyl esterase